MASKGLRIGLAGFIVALVGVLAAFGGFEIGQRWLSIAGFILTVAGVVVGFVGIGYIWVTEGKQAVTGSLGAARKLANKITRREGGTSHGNSREDDL